MIAKPEFLSSFGRRMGRGLSDATAALMREAMPRLEITPQTDFSTFAAYPAVHLEIGFGAGEHLIGRAEAAPETLFIGCEPFINAVAKCVREIVAKNITNIRLYTDDARHLLQALPEETISQVYILFPDPWPKKRAQKRRIVNQQTLDMLARIQPIGGQLLCATDHDDYAAWMAAHLKQHAAYTPIENAAIPPQGWVQTRYQCKMLAADQSPHFFQYRRV